MPDPAAAGAARRRLWLHGVGSGAAASDRYAERALPLACADDVVCVPQAIDPEYLGYLASVGLGPAAANVLALRAGDAGAATLPARLLADRSALARLVSRLSDGACEIHPYAGTADVFALQQALEAALARPVPVHAPAPAVAELAGRRDVVRTRAIELGVPVADGEVVILPPHGRRRRDLEPLRAAIARRLRCVERVLVRAAAVQCGAARWIAGHGGEDPDDVLRLAADQPGQRTYLVESLTETTVCATVHVRVSRGAGGVRVLGITDRRLNRGLAAAGTRLPTAARTAECMERWAATLAGWLHDIGYVGVATLDFAEHRDAAGRSAALFTGLAPRPGEASYALGLASALGAGACVSGMVATRASGFGRVREALGGLLYHPDRGAGVLPYATGWLDQGRCAVVALAADRLHAAELLGKATAALDAVDTAAGRTLS